MIDFEKEIKAFGDKYRVKENKSVSNHKRGTWFFEDISFNDQDEKILINLRIIWLGWLDCAKSKQTEINELKAKLDSETKISEGFRIVSLDFLKSINRVAVDAFYKWDFKKEPMPQICEYLQDFSYYMTNNKAMIEAAQENEDE